MARISLQEQYENKDVIQQINILKDKMNEVSETTEDTKAVADEALLKVGTTEALAQQASDRAGEAETLAQQATDTAETTEALAQQASDKADAAVTTVQGSVASGSIVADTVSAKLKLNKVSGESEESVIPIASASQTGMMNAQTYAGITNLDARVSVLERKSITVYVTFPSNDPEQSIITSTFETKAGRAPGAGDYAVDIAKNLTYGYDGSVWAKVGSDVTIPQFSNDTPGLIKGNDEDGTVFAEADGTGSVMGWDALKQSVADNVTAIAQNSTAIQENSTNVSALDTRVTTLESVPESAQWEELNISNLPTDFQAGDIMMCFVKTIITGSSGTLTWDKAPEAMHINIYSPDDEAHPAIFTIGTTLLYPNTPYSVNGSDSCVKIDSLVSAQSVDNWNSDDSTLELLRLNHCMFNGAGRKGKTTYVRRDNLSEHVYRILRLRP